jgi:hypothetical protein
MINVVFAGLVGTILCRTTAVASNRGAEGRQPHAPDVILRGTAPQQELHRPATVVATSTGRCRARHTPRPSWTSPAWTTCPAAGVRQPAREQGRLSHDRAIDLQMAANEIATNTVRHAGAVGSVRVWAEDGHVLCDITDSGHVEVPWPGGWHRRSPARAAAACSSATICATSCGSTVCRLHDRTAVRAHILITWLASSMRRRSPRKRTPRRSSPSRSTVDGFRAPHGGYMVAILARAAGVALAEPGHVDPLAVSAHFLSSPVAGRRRCGSNRCAPAAR